MIKKSLFIVFCLLSIAICSFVFAADSELTLDTSDSGSGFTVKNSIGEPVMRARGDGNVGIGTTNPTEKLEIGGTAGVDGIKFPDGTLQTTAATGGQTQQEAWQTPTLSSPWANFNNESPTGYFKDSMGVVHFRGLVNAGPHGSTIFTLPAGYRPEYNRVHPIQSQNGIGRCDIFTNGTAVIYFPSGASAPVWNSLAGITFRAQ